MVKDLPHYFIVGRDIGYWDIGGWLSNQARAFFVNTLRRWNNGQIYTLRDNNDRIVSKMKSVPNPRELLNGGE